MAIPGDAVYRGKITVQNSKVSGSSDHSNFPVLLTKDNFWAELMGAGTESATNGGGGLRFSSDEAGTTQIAHEVVSFITSATESSRRAEVWVKAPTLSYNTDTDIHVWSSPTASKEAATSTYGSEAVWGQWRNVAHGKDLTDSAGGTAFTILSGSPSVNSTGVIGGAFQAGGGGSFEIVGDTGITGSSARTVTAWVNRRNQSGAESVIAEWGTNTSGGEWTLRYSSGKLRVEFEGSWVEATAANSSDTYYKVTVVQKGTDTDSIDLYQNDTLLTVNRSANTTINTVAGSNFTIFESPHTAGRFLSGFIDELRVIESALSADWIATEYNNQSDPSTFAIAGTFQTGGGTAHSLTLSESINASAANSALWAIAANTPESIAATSTQSASADFAVSASESVNAASSQSASAAFATAVAEAVAAADIQSISFALESSISEALVTGSAQASVISIDGAVSESIGAASTQSAAAAFAPSVAFSAAVAESVITAAAYQTSYADSIQAVSVESIGIARETVSFTITVQRKTTLATHVATATLN